jgi:hypothetical protein
LNDYLGCSPPLEPPHNRCHLEVQWQPSKHRMGPVLVQRIKILPWNPITRAGVGYGAMDNRSPCFSECSGQPPLWDADEIAALLGSDEAPCVTLRASVVSRGRVDAATTPAADGLHWLHPPHRIRRTLQCSSEPPSVWGEATSSPPDKRVTTKAPSGHTCFNGHNPSCRRMHTPRMPGGIGA